MELTQKDNSFSSRTSFTPRKTFLDDRNDETTNDVSNTVPNNENISRKDYCILSGQRFETTSQDSDQYEVKKTLHRLIEEMLTSPTTGFFCKPLQFLRRRHGLVLTLLSSMFFSIMNLSIDVLTETLDSFQIVFMYVPILMICCLVLIIYAGIRPSSDYKHYLWLLGAGSCEAVALCVVALSLNYLAVGDTVTLVRTSVIQVGFISWLVLKEPLQLFDFLFALIAFGGVIFIARPPFIFRNYSMDTPAYGGTLEGILSALTGSFTIAMFIVFNRKLSKLGVNSLFCIFFNATVAVFFSGLISLILNRWRCPTMHEWLLALLAGVMYAFGQVTIFYALKVETATLVTVVSTIQIFYAFLGQALFLGVPPIWTSYIGAILIFAACAGITVKNKPPSPAPSEFMDAEHCRAI